MFSTQSKSNFAIITTIEFLFTNHLNMDKSNILSFGRVELQHIQLCQGSPHSFMSVHPTITYVNNDCKKHCILQAKILYLTSLMCLYVLMRSTLSFRSGADPASRKFVGIRFCMATISCCCCCCCSVSAMMTN